MHLSKVAAYETPVHACVHLSVKDHDPQVHAGVQCDKWAPVAQTSDICLVVCNNHQSQLHSCLCDFCAAQLIDPLRQIATNKLAVPSLNAFFVIPQCMY